MQSLEIFSTPWILACCTVLFAAFIRGLTGFGLALILAPILLLILNPVSVVVINVLLALLSNVLVLLRSFARINYRQIVPMVLSSLLGIPLGVWIITVITPTIFKIFIGAIIIAFAVPTVIGSHKTFVREKEASCIAGFFSGMFSSSTSLGGPPIVIFMHNQNWPKEIIYTSLAVYFLFLGCFSLGGLSLAGQVSAEMIITAVSLAPSTLAGIILGMIMFRRVNARFFRRLSISVIICAGLISIVSGLGIFF